MVTCKKCGVTLPDARKCSYCQHVYCTNHRFPERHDCSGVKQLDKVGRRFDSGFEEPF